MQVELIFTCWAATSEGALRRIEVVAPTAAQARRATFVAFPRAVSVSCRGAATVAGKERRDGVMLEAAV